MLINYEKYRIKYTNKILIKISQKLFVYFPRNNSMAYDKKITLYIYILCGLINSISFILLNI